ncbi:hypothetical protein FEM48_Zijuj08G0178500 [Ziziphus jujuba var. spinosa]|uniref:Uncharacterized protein n=1 Tax=Ziziphus jujuba var. spinosa TaxID=714518 RepID=A0A978V0I3_ZIZJJ|nr:hypothetical protein FEM48_Zijuj08G0178500 [Ziziphus jujuba var. spinosa]
MLMFDVDIGHPHEKLYQWILRQQEEGSRVATVDIVSYLQNELEYGGEEPPMSPRPPFQQQHSHSTNLGPTVTSNLVAPATVGQGVRWGHTDQQPKNSVFSNALSSPVRRSLHQAAQGGYNSNNFMSGNGPRNNETNCPHQNRETTSPTSNDSMDMHADSPSHEYPY